MIMSEKCKQHVDSCRFCWMCHHICPIGNATGQERNTARARALGISLVNRGAMDLSEIVDNVYECATCGACVHDCTTGWDPVMFTKETRLQAALDGKLPGYIANLVENCLTTGNAYGIYRLMEAEDLPLGILMCLQIGDQPGSLCLQNHTIFGAVTTRIQYGKMSISIIE